MAERVQTFDGSTTALQHLRIVATQYGYINRQRKLNFEKLRDPTYPPYMQSLLQDVAIITFTDDATVDVRLPNVCNIPPRRLPRWMSKASLGVGLCTMADPTPSASSSPTSSRALKQCKSESSHYDQSPFTFMFFYSRISSVENKNKKLQNNIT